MHVLEVQLQIDDIGAGTVEKVISYKSITVPPTCTKC